MNVFITFGSTGYEQAMNILGDSARPYFDEIRQYKPSDIDYSFAKENASVFSHSRGFGYWLWKPYFILKTLQSLSYGDTVFYSDAHGKMVADPARVITACRNNGGLLAGFFRYQEKMWTRRDAFILTNTDTEEYWNSYHANAAHQVYEKNDKALTIVNEWLQYCRDERIVADGSCIYGENFPEFRDHRHDQSILSLVYKKNKIPFNKCLCQIGDKMYKEDGFMGHSDYGPVIEHKRFC